MNGEQLRGIRSQLGLSQDELAIMLRASRQAVGKWERGERRISGVTETAVLLLLELRGSRKN